MGKGTFVSEFATSARPKVPALFVRESGAPRRDFTELGRVQNEAAARPLLVSEQLHPGPILRGERKGGRVSPRVPLDTIEDLGPLLVSNRLHK